jgi:hypothetical protein
VLETGQEALPRGPRQSDGLAAERNLDVIDAPSPWAENLDEASPR